MFGTARVARPAIFVEVQFREVSGQTKFVQLSFGGLIVSAPHYFGKRNVVARSSTITAEDMFKMHQL